MKKVKLSKLSQSILALTYIVGLSLLVTKTLFEPDDISSLEYHGNKFWFYVGGGASLFIALFLLFRRGLKKIFDLLPIVLLLLAVSANQAQEIHKLKVQSLILKSSSSSVRDGLLISKMHDSIDNLIIQHKFETDSITLGFQVALDSIFYKVNFDLELIESYYQRRIDSSDASNVQLLELNMLLEERNSYLENRKIPIYLDSIYKDSIYIDSIKQNYEMRLAELSYELDYLKRKYQKGLGSNYIRDYNRIGKLATRFRVAKFALTSKWYTFEQDARLLITKSDTVQKEHSFPILTRFRDKRYMRKNK